MTTVTPFTPSPVLTPPFQFQAVLGSATYNVQVTSNLFGNRWYVSVVASDGTVLVTKAIAASPAGVQLAGLSWGSGLVAATTAAPHGLTVGSVAELVIAGATPDGYNGLQQCHITGRSSFTYPLDTDPGLATIFGSAGPQINLVGGITDPVTGAPFTSSMIFREGANQFEVSP